MSGITLKLETTPTQDNLRENYVRWFGHVHKRPIDKQLEELII